MFHKAIKLEFDEGTALELTFQDGKVKRYDMAVLFDKYPQLAALKNRKLFTSGRLMGFYGIIWNDDLDIEAETIYKEGETIRVEKPATGIMIGNIVSAARAKKGLSQKALSEVTGIDQSDLSKIERGVANPSIGTLSRIAEALDTKLVVSFE
ncbi:MAG: helix-turn-helix domain-containing protein [Lachnospiraceae bacterium]|nr:helix-turn-helix domain-containing protein [Lachnospiraceae bacterium]